MEPDPVGRDLEVCEAAELRLEGWRRLDELSLLIW